MIKKVSASAKTKAVFLDRDGVINDLIYFPEHGLIDTPFTARQFHLIAGVTAAIKQLQSAGFKAVIISNQPGVAKKHMPLSNFREICATMRDQMATDGVVLDGEYYCLHHPEALVAKYKANCACRKPKPGLLLQAAKEMNIDLANSWFIGDNLTDVQAGQNAGVHTLLLGKMKCELCDQMDKEGVRPEAIKSSLRQAADFIIKAAHI
jgi:D-glycero-D-manno-heptose 1,7-bisphosphate phosphatase